MTSQPPIGQFAVWLRSLRSRFGVSQSVMATQLGVTAQYYTLLENGHRCPGPTLRLLLRQMGTQWLMQDMPACAAPRYQSRTSKPAVA